MISVIHKHCGKETFKLLRPHTKGNMFRAPDTILPNGQYPVVGEGVECTRCGMGMWPDDCDFIEVPPMKTRYKVVKTNRISAIVNGNSKYALRYMPETIVQAHPWTYGVFLFKYKSDAENWCYSINSKGFLDRWSKNTHKVIEVEPLVKGKQIRVIPSRVYSDYIDKYYRSDHFDFSGIRDTPRGTYCHMAVRVLT